MAKPLVVSTIFKRHKNPRKCKGFTFLFSSYFPYFCWFTLHCVTSEQSVITASALLALLRKDKMPYLVGIGELPILLSY